MVTRVMSGASPESPAASTYVAAGASSRPAVDGAASRAPARIAAAHDPRNFMSGAFLEDRRGNLLRGAPGRGRDAARRAPSPSPAGGAAPSGALRGPGGGALGGRGGVSEGRSLGRRPAPGRPTRGLPPRLARRRDTLGRPERLGRARGPRG